VAIDTVAPLSREAARHWQQLHAGGDLQFAPLPPAPPPAPPPGWLTSLLDALGHLLKALFGPVGRALGVGWPAMEWALAGIGVLVVLALLWRLARHLLAKRHAGTSAEPDWIPTSHEAHSLLDEADRLASAGHFDEAAHLLLLRSVEHIAQARPLWLHPASTTREIAALAALPPAARTAFALIAARVEQSRFALRALGGEDWQAARAAYADFALAKAPA